MRLLVLITVLYVLQKSVNCEIDDRNETEKLNEQCDQGEMEVNEGNIGQRPVFPWLGILRVHIHERNIMKLALTGLVLVKRNYAIGNAYDLAKIPRMTLLTDSKVMFILGNDETWFCKVQDFMAHPEYEVTTFHTIGVLELLLEDMSIPAKPICWPYTNFNTENELFVIGYTDENELLEKSIYQLQFVDRQLCEEFYSMMEGEVIEKLSIPSNYECAFGINSKRNCTWENGRVVASNISGEWTLIGIIVAGPGCSAPARFISITSYLPWLLTTMDLDANQFDMASDFPIT